MRENDNSAEGGRKVSLVTALVLAISLAAGGVIGGAFVGPKLTNATPLPEGEKAEVSKDHGGQASPDGHAQLYTVESLVVNPAGTAGSRFLIISLALDVAGPVDPLKNNEARLRDVLLTVLSKKSVEELADISKRDALKEELLAAIKEAISDAGIRAIYFPQYVLQ